MAKSGGIDTIARVDDAGPLEGHGRACNINAVKKGTFMQVGECVELSETPYSPNKKTGTASGGEKV